MTKKLYKHIGIFIDKVCTGTGKKAQKRGLFSPRKFCHNSHLQLYADTLCLFACKGVRKCTKVCKCKSILLLSTPCYRLELIADTFGRDYRNSAIICASLHFFRVDRNVVIFAVAIVQQLSSYACVFAFCDWINFLF